MDDELVKRLRCQRFGNCPNCPMWYTEEVEPNLWRERCAAIDAADAVEELSKRVPKSGVWREEESGYDDVFYECSVCGAGVCTIEGDPVDNAWSYCPECGAKMTGIERLPQPPEEET